MKLVIQRVKKASVKVEEEVVGSIEKGLLVLVGFQRGDTEKEIPWFAKKLVGLRIFPDQEGKMNLSIGEVEGSILIVSQFTLYADCSKGKRPSFIEAERGEEARQLYLSFVKEVKRLGAKVETGRFAAKMEVSLVNDGPITLVVQ